MKQEIFIIACLICCIMGTREYMYSCPEPGDAAWIDKSNDMNCPPGTEYHCAKDYDKPFVEGSAMFIQACAKVKYCKAGEEPLISLVRDEQHLKITDADVYCETCRDPRQYNSVANKATNMFTQCPLNKQHVCLSSDNKINCLGETHMTDHLCRCDARQSYKPDDVDVGQCFEQSWIRCMKYTCPADRQLLLNYTCAPNCPVNYIRTNDSDDCIPTRLTSAAEITSPPTSALMSFSPISSTEAPNLTTDKHSAAKKPELSKDEKIMIIVLTVLILVAISIAVLVYHKRHVVWSTIKRLCGKCLPQGFTERQQKDVALDEESVPLNDKSYVDTFKAQTATLCDPNHGTTIINIHKTKYNINTMNKGKNIYIQGNLDNEDAETDSLFENTYQESHSDSVVSNTDHTNENLHDLDQTVGKFEEKNFEDPKTQIRERSWYKISEDQTIECMKIVLDKTSNKLHQDMDPVSLLDDCLQKKLLTFNEIRDIRELPFTTDKNRKIVQTVRRKDFNKYLDFKKSLHQTDQLAIIRALHTAEDDEMHKYLKGKAFECSDEFESLDQKHSQSNNNKTVDGSSHEPCRDISPYNPLLDQLLHENVDENATLLIPSKWRNKNIDCEYIALKSSGDGNCFFNSCSLMLEGDESLSQKLRQDVAEELEINAPQYCQNHHHIQSIVKDRGLSSDEILACYASMLSNNDLSLDTLCDAVINEGRETHKDHSYSSMLQLMAASTVLNREIVSLFPETNFKYRDLYHAVIHPVTETTRLKLPYNCKFQQPIILLWSRNGDPSMVDKMYTPNHVVPVVGRIKTGSHA